ncbi:uncharacterized protein LOC123193094 [Mangifera indica]|uniref:uncharacterized protein LOC123193094 n=1 Tax=Mangifera indica TaxID=29780 RepID=UPI001CFA4127|nr:uncharacterized protein LOC123193094 [Mangifera indica]
MVDNLEKGVETLQKFEKGYGNGRQFGIECEKPCKNLRKAMQMVDNLERAVSEKVRQLPKGYEKLQKGWDKHCGHLEGAGIAERVRQQGDRDYNSVKMCDDVVDDAGVSTSVIAPESLVGCNPFFGVPKPYRDVENEGIVVHTVAPSGGCSIRAFREYCRPVICIDGTFLKGRYWCTLFIVVGKDGNNQIYLIAFRVGEREEMMTWTLFLRALHKCIGDLTNLAIISNRHQAITRFVREVFPNVHHGWCNHHIKGNMRARYKQTKHIERLFWRVAKAYRTEDFEEALHMIKAENPPAAAYLEGIDYARWVVLTFLASDITL